MKPKSKIKIDIKSKRKIVLSPKSVQMNRPSAYDWSEVINTLKGQQFTSEELMLEGVIEAIVKESGQDNTQELRAFLRTSLQTDETVMRILKEELM